MGAGGGLAFHGHREAGDGLEDGVLVAAILARADGAAFVTDQRAHGGDGAHHGGKDAGDHLLLGQHHGGVAKAAGGVPGAMDAVLAGDLVQLGPEEAHVAHAQDAEAEDDAAQVARHEGLVVDLLAADRFDAEQFGAGGGAALERGQHGFVERAAAHAGRALHLARVVGRDAQDALEAVLGVRAGHGVQQDARQFDAPGRVLGHGRQRLELDHQAGRLQFHGALQGAGDDLLILHPHVRHRAGVHGHGRQGEIEFRVNQPAADGQALAGGEGFGRDAEAQVGGIADSETPGAKVRSPESKVQSRGCLGGGRAGLGACGRGRRVSSNRVCIVHHHGQRYATFCRRGMDESRIGMKKPWIGGSGGFNAKTLRSKDAD